MIQVNRPLPLVAEEGDDIEQVIPGENDQLCSSGLSDQLILLSFSLSFDFSQNKKWKTDADDR